MDEMYDGEESLHDQTDSYVDGLLNGEAEVDAEVEYRIYDF